MGTHKSQMANDDCLPYNDVCLAYPYSYDDFQDLMEHNPILIHCFRQQYATVLWVAAWLPTLKLFFWCLVMPIVMVMLFGVIEAKWIDYHIRWYPTSTLSTNTPPRRNQHAIYPVPQHDNVHARK